MLPPEPLWSTPPGGTPQERKTALLIRQGDYVDFLRRQKGKSLTKKPAAEEVDEFLTSGEWSSYEANRISKRLESEASELTHLPDVVQSYDDFEMPALNDEPLPWEPET